MIEEQKTDFEKFGMQMLSKNKWINVIRKNENIWTYQVVEYLDDNKLCYREHYDEGEWITIEHNSNGYKGGCSICGRIKK